MSWYPDMARESMVATGDHVRAVGWLSSSYPFTQGTVRAKFVTRLREFVRLSNESASALYFPAFGGLHDCQFCGEDRDSRNFGVPSGSVLFVAPAMVAHYVERHKNLPPAEFLVAVMPSPLPDTEEYKALAAPFGRLHKLAWERHYQQQIEYAGRWAFEQGGGEEAVREAANRFMGHALPEMCQRIRRSMPNSDHPGTMTPE
jgi:hypothetical protein